MTSILEVRGLTKSFGGLMAVSGLDFGVERGEILGLIGPNGAGKTTVFNLITGVHKPDEGHVFLQGEDISGRPTHEIARKGIGRTFQITSLFFKHSVLQNVMAGYHLHSKAGFWGSMVASQFSRREEKKFEEKALDILRFVGLDKAKHQQAHTLPYGHKRLLAICVALAAEPRLLLLDEPLAGLNPEESMEQVEKIKEIRKATDLTMLLVEHNMRAVMNVCDRLVVMSFGRKIAEGAPKDVQEDSVVIESYLGRRRVS